MTFFKRMLVVSFILLTASWGFAPQTEAASDADITCSIKAEPSVVSSPSEIVTLSWETDTDVDSAYINNGIGFVPSKGSISLQGFTQDFSYTLTAKKGVKTKDCSVKIKVEASSETDKPASLSCEITATPQATTAGSSVLVSWNAPDASRAVLEGYGVVHKNGQMVIEGVSGTKTFVLRVSNENAQGICSATVYKNDIPKGPAPACELNVIGKTILKSNESTTLSWRTLNAEFAQITHIGQVPLKGEMTINPPQTTHYIMVVRDKYGREGFCEKTVEVQTANFIATQTNSPGGIPAVQNQISYIPNYIPLNYIPYTGASWDMYIYAMLALLSTAGIYLLGKKLITA